MPRGPDARCHRGAREGLRGSGSKDYFGLEPVPVLLCFGFFGVFAFLSIVILHATGAGGRRKGPRLTHGLTTE